ncbi:DDE-type integrase/transposase/recombinase [Caulobacter sp. S45]|uniref:DDE-type integrase/transposase/recombinase n=1 Tax=Caulobacter sp. S45 TaxID=1641861 RepID=UPI001576DCA4
MNADVVTKKRDKAAALKFIKKAQKRHGPPKAITTDGLRSYKAALKEVGIADHQEIGRWADNRPCSRPIHAVIRGY